AQDALLVHEEPDLLPVDDGGAANVVLPAIAPVSHGISKAGPCSTPSRTRSKRRRLHGRR
ncbi:MAG: hypothetical protein ACK559_08545, partial [bacterium]